MKNKTLTDKQKAIARGMNRIMEFIDDGSFGPEDAEIEIGKAYAAGLRFGSKQPKDSE